MRKHSSRSSAFGGIVLCNGGVEIPINREEVRERLRRMSDEKLRDFGRACVYMSSPQANLGKPPREEFVVQLEEARAEWRRRHPSDEFSERATGV
jgi:uncharacterized protein YjiS (DUF1127 family)